MGLFLPFIVVAGDIQHANLVRIMWPFAIFGFGYQVGGSWLFASLLAVLEFAGNALLYGLIGALIANTADAIHKGNERKITNGHQRHRGTGAYGS